MVDVSTLVVISLTNVVVWGLLGYLLHGRRAEARREAESGDLILEYSWRAKGLVIVFAILIAGMFSMILAYAGLPKPSDVPWAVGTAAMFVGLLAPFGVEFFGTSVRVNSAGIHQRSGWTGRKKVRWDEVESVSFSEAMGWYRLRTAYGTIRVGAFLNGVPEFLEFARRRLPSNKWTGPGPKSWLYRG